MIIHGRYHPFFSLGCAFLVALLLAACAPAGSLSPAPEAPPGLLLVAPSPHAVSPSPAAVAAVAEPLPAPAATALVTATATATAPPTLTAAATASATPTTIHSPTPAVTATATYWPTVTRQVLPPAVAAGLPACAARTVDDDLLTLVTQQFGLPAAYVPSDLVPLSNYLPREVTRDQEFYVRQPIVEPLLRLLQEMAGAGLAPSILSGYRSYQEQQLAWHWWNGQYPDRVAIMSALAGHSEHQLGTTVDFGSPELDHLFHVDFAATAEGEWLAANAHRFGFTQSFTRDAYAVTGFKYEPWHYRYVGESLALELQRTGQILTAWQLQQMSPPCIP